MNKKEKNLSSVLFVIGGSALGALSAFFLQIIIARSLSIEEFGIFSSAYSLAAIFSPLAGLGIGQFLLRSFSHEGTNSLNWSDLAKKYVHITSLLTFMLVFCILQFNDQSFIFNANVASIVLSMVALEIISVKFQLERNYKRLAFWQPTPHLLRLILVALILFFCSWKLNLYTASLAIVIATILFIILSFKQISDFFNKIIDLSSYRLISLPEVNVNRTVLNVLNGAWPFGVVSFLFLMYFQFSIAYGFVIAGPDAAATISISVTILTALYLLPSTIYQKFLAPKISFWFFNNHITLKKVYYQGSLLMFITGLLIALITYIISNWFVIYIFGIKYQHAIPFMQILLFSVPARFLGISFGSFFIKENAAIKKVLILSFIFLVNILLSFLLSFKFSYYGIAYSLVFSELLLAMMLFFFSRNSMRDALNA